MVLLRIDPPTGRVLDQVLLLPRLRETRRDQGEEFLSFLTFEVSLGHPYTG